METMVGDLHESRLEEDPSKVRRDAPPSLNNNNHHIFPAASPNRSLEEEEIGNK